MKVKNDMSLINKGRRERSKRKKQLIVSGLPTGTIPYEQLYDEALENYQCYLSYHNPLDPGEIWNSILDMISRGSLEFSEIREQYGRMIKKGVR